ncbi:MAG: metal-dependent transcriptional regulator [Candidatus Asgardarchaeia archaeon]
MEELTPKEVEYILSIYRALKEEKKRIKTTELAKMMGVKAGTVVTFLKKMDEKGVIEKRAFEEVKLTEEGMIIAEKYIWKHRVLECLLFNFIEDKERVCVEASLLTPYISDEMAAAICTKMGHPEVCPCGKPIPHPYKKEKKEAGT